MNVILVELKIVNIKGDLVYTSQTRNSAEAWIELNDSPGIYFLTIKSGKDKKTIKLIKQ